PPAPAAGGAWFSKSQLKPRRESWPFGSRWGWGFLDLAGLYLSRRVWQPPSLPLHGAGRPSSLAGREFLLLARLRNTRNVSPSLDSSPSMALPGGLRPLSARFEDRNMTGSLLGSRSPSGKEL